MVGHTHEDIDQMFSCISKRISEMSIFSMEKLAEEVALAYSFQGKPVEVVIGVDNVCH
jgi:hypothetical protein